MRQDPLDQEAAELDPEGIDTGEPIVELQSLKAEPRPGFFGRLRRRIQRTRFAGDATTLAWTAPWLVLRELLEMIFGGGRSEAGRRGLKSPRPSDRQGPGTDRDLQN